jgi:vacuolar-type H+-ATPase subunit B/Vma2
MAAQLMPEVEVVVIAPMAETVAETVAVAAAARVVVVVAKAAAKVE